MSIDRKKKEHSTIAGHRRRNRIAGSFTPLLTDMLESPAWRVLSLSARRVLDRLAIELRHHAGHEGEGLCVTYADFQEYGIERHCIAPAIREAVALGFLRIARQGRGGNSEFRVSTLYKLTYLNAIDGGERTHDWKRITSLEEAEAISREARADRKTKSRCAKPAPLPVRKTRTETGDFPVRKTRTTVVGEMRTTSDSLREEELVVSLEPERQPMTTTPPRLRLRVATSGR